MSAIQISVLLPTRERPQPLERSLWSLHDNAYAPEQVEYLLRTDEDDAPYDLSAFPFQDRIAELRAPRVGYARLHECYRELGKRARGKILLVWNDDAVMLTHGWDERLLAVDRPLVQFSGPHPSFPAVDRRIFELLDGFGRHTAVDSWLITVAQAAGCYRMRDDVEHLHDKFDDELLCLNRSIARSPNNGYENFEVHRREDALKLREWLARQ